jgi:hypothetical protein
MTLVTSSRTTRAPRVRLGLAGVVATAVAASLLTVTGPAEAVAPSVVATTANPDLSISCGLDVVLVLDRSYSILTSNNVANVKAAATSFVKAFQDTNTRVGIVKFSSEAQAAVPLTFDTAESGAPTGALGASIASYAAGGQTNWEDALIKTNTEFAAASSRRAPRLVVFVTDGQPNTYNLANGLPSAQLPNGDPLAVDPAVTQANTIKATYRAHVLAVGIGALIDQPATDRLMQISGTDVTTSGTPAFDAQTTDVIVQPDFTALGGNLRAVADQVCKGSLTVTQSATSAASPVVHRNGGAGWNVTTTTDTPGDWLLPAVADPSATTASVASNVDGTSVFQWDPPSPMTRSARVTVTLKPHYVFQGVTCTRNDVPIAGVPQSRIFTVPGGVPSGASVACTVMSRWTGPLASLLSLAPGSRTVLYGTTGVRLTGVLRSPVRRLPSSVVALWTRAGGSAAWSRVALARTSSTGGYSFTVAPRMNHSYRVTYAGSATHYAVTSIANWIRVAPRVSATVRKTGAGLRYRAMSGAFAPGFPHGRVALQRLVKGRWISVATTTLSSRGTYRFTWRRGNYAFYYRVVKAATVAYAAASSHRILV